MIDSLYTRNFYPTNISGKHTRDSDCDPEIFHTPQSMSNICSVEVERTIFSRNFDIFLCVQKYPQHFFFFRKLNFFSLVFSNKKKSYSYKLYPVRKVVWGWTSHPQVHNILMTEMFLILMSEGREPLHVLSLSWTLRTTFTGIRFRSSW